MMALQKEGKEVTEECTEDTSRDKQKKKEVYKKTKNEIEEEETEDEESDDEDEEVEILDEDFFHIEEQKIPCTCEASNTCGVKILEEKCTTCECPDFGPEHQHHKCRPLNPLATPHCCSCEEVHKNVIGGLLSRVVGKFVSKCRMYQEELRDRKEADENVNKRYKNMEEEEDDDDDDDFESFRRRKYARKRRNKEKLISRRRKDDTKRRRTEARRGKNGLNRGMHVVKHDKNLMKPTKNDLKRNKQLKYKSKLIRTYFSPLNIPRSI